MAIHPLAIDQFPEALDLMRKGGSLKVQVAGKHDLN